MDDRVRPSHAANEGKVLAWKDGDGPGTEENCRCSAEPFPEYTDIDDPPIIPVYPLETLIALWLGLGAASKIGKEILDQFTDDKPTAPAPETPKPEVPAEKPLEKPNGVPKNWEQSPSRNEKGVRYRDPKNLHNEVRVQKGDPKVSNPSQQRDYVKWKRDGQWLDKNGNPVSGNSPESHIPVGEFKFDLEIFK